MEMLNYIVKVEEEDLGIDMIAFTDNPAIITKGLAFSNNENLYFKDDKKYRIIAPAMTPGKIYRRNGEEEFYVEFTKENIEQIFIKFMSELNNGKDIFNLEHNAEVKVPAFILEAWIVEDEFNDKSRKYGIEAPIGTLMLVSQITDKEYYNKLVKSDKVGFSIEGFFGLELELNETYNDYPKAATENAKIALRWADENGWGDCGTPVGKKRANQLANGESISRDTIARMAAFERHRQNSQKELGDGCGRLMWLAWGGDEGVEWAQRKLKQIDNEKFIDEKNNELEMKKEFKTNLTDGEWMIGNKIIYVKNGYVEKEEVEEEVEMTETETETEIVAENEKETEKVEAQEEVEVEEEVVETKSLTDEEKTAIISELMIIIEPKFEEIYEMIASIKADLGNMVVEEEKEVELEFNAHNRLQKVINFITK